VKPANLFVAGEGGAGAEQIMRVFLGDFSLSRQLEQACATRAFGLCS